MNILNMKQSTETKQKLKWDERKEAYLFVASKDLF